MPLVDRWKSSVQKSPEIQFGMSGSPVLSSVTAVAVDPTSPSTWLAGRLIDARILRTTDQGATWQTVLPPLGQETSLTGRRSIHRIVYAPSSPSSVYAATGIAPSYVPHDTPGPGVYRSVDGGLT